MKRILLIGPGGGGKTTLARELAARTGLPRIHLDALFWQPGWVATPKDAWRRRIESLVAQDAWIMDGNYGGTLDLRLAACDTVLFLDVPPWRCLARVLKRRVQNRGRAREELPEGCDERLTLEFLLWVATYRRRHRPSVLAKLELARRAGKRVIELRTDADVAALLADIPAADRREWDRVTPARRTPARRS